MAGELHPHQQRVLDLLKRFARAEDMALADHEFVRALLKRYAAYREEPIIDVGE